MGKISSVKVDNFNKNICSSCGASAKTGCCRTDFKVIKLNSTHQPVIPSNELKTLKPAPVNAFNYTTFFYSFVISKQAIANPPPLLSSKDIFLKNCVFRI